MAHRMLQYRGSLKSCNYSCSYCPFAKHRPTPSGLERDREDWECFVCHFETQAGDFSAVMVVPYGEALIHDWYWDGLARLSRIGTLEAAGAQTNLSFDVKRRLNAYESAGGRREKLRLWATFHPEMTTVSQFADQCLRLKEAGVRFSAGAVGVPANLDMLVRLREALPESIYLWINRMDGLKRRYTKEEENAFSRIDPWFSRELRLRKADPSKCRDRIFVESDGRMRLCSIAVPSSYNWYENSKAEALPCGKNACTCYLAYGGRADCTEKTAFGRWPLFRIPWSPQAVFLDLDGTILPECTKAAPAVSSEWIHFIEREARTKYVFLATSLPQREAAERCTAILPWISGGIYASGAHVVFHGTERPGSFNVEHGRKEHYHTFETPWLSKLSEIQSMLGFRLRIYRHNSQVYKITLSRPKGRMWEKEKSDLVTRILTTGDVRCFAECSQLQIVSREADKGSGVRELCAFAGIRPLDTAAVGNDAEDIPMFNACGFGIAAGGGSASARDTADFISECLPADIRFHTSS